MELELGEVLGGRKVDLDTPESLSPHFRDDVLGEAQMQYTVTERLQARDSLVGDPEDLMHLDWSSEWRPYIDPDSPPSK